MSKAIKNVAGNTLGNTVLGSLVDDSMPKQNFSSGYNLIDYYNNVDTSLKDVSNNLMAQEGYNLAQTLSDRPDYVYTVNGSDEARQQAQAATFQSYMDSLTPQFASQAEDLQTRMANQGIAPGTAAYNSALNSMYSAQNAAVNSAAQQSVLQGQNAYTQSLQDAINTANFSNNARSGALNEINTALQNALSNYDTVLNKYNVQNKIATQETQNWQKGMQNLLNIAGQLAKVAQ